MLDDEMLELPPEVFGRCKAPAGTWASAIRVIDPVEVRAYFFRLISRTVLIEL
jgi:splicing factor 3B subunit 3